MEAVVVIAGTVALVWGGVVFLRGGLLGGCLAVLLAGTCFSLPFYKIELGPLPLTVDRLLIVLLVMQYVLWRRWGLVQPKPRGRPEIVLLLFLGAMILNTLFTDWAASNYQPPSRLIVFYLMPAVMYGIARQIDYSERTMKVLWACLAAFGVYAALTSLAEYFQAWAFVFPRYIGETASENKLEFIGRGRGPLLNPIGNGILLSVCLGAALMGWPRLGRVGRAAILMIVVLFLAALFSGMTRSVWMGGLFTLILVVGVALPWSWRLPLLGGGVLAALLAVALQWDNLVSFKRDKNLTAEQTAESVQLRPVLAAVAWRMFLDRPVFGCGFSQYINEHPNYLADRSTDLPLERARGYIPHNVVFSLLTETGLVGLSLFAALLFYWTRDAWRWWRGAGAPLWARQQGLLLLVALGAYLINGMFHDVSVVPMAHMTLFFLAGVTAALRPL